MLFYFSGDSVIHTHTPMASQVVQLVKNLPANAGDAKMWVLTPGSGRSTKVENGKPLQYSCLENSMDRGNWWATVLGVSKRCTQLSKHSCIEIYIQIDRQTDKR